MELDTCWEKSDFKNSSQNINGITEWLILEKKINYRDALIQTPW